MSELIHLMYEHETSCDPESEKDLVESFTDLQLQECLQKLGGRALEIVRLIGVVVDEQDKRSVS